VYLKAVEQKQKNATVAELSSGDAFSDFGTNLGYYSLAASRLVGGQGGAMAIEPSVRNVGYLFLPFGMNHVENVKEVCAAYSNRQGLSPMIREQNYSEGHIVTRSGKITGPESTLDFVSVTTPDDFTGKERVVPILMESCSAPRTRRPHGGV
jgi:FkbM family methyltransferase